MNKPPAGIRGERSNKAKGGREGGRGSFLGNNPYLIIGLLVFILIFAFQSFPAASGSCRIDRDHLDRSCAAIRHQHCRFVPSLPVKNEPAFIQPVVAHFTLFTLNQKRHWSYFKVSSIFCGRFCTVDVRKMNDRPHCAVHKTCFIMMYI